MWTTTPRAQPPEKKNAFSNWSNARVCLTRTRAPYLTTSTKQKQFTDGGERKNQTYQGSHYVPQTGHANHSLTEGTAGDR